jgi:hypothetical protein
MWWLQVRSAAGLLPVELLLADGDCLRRAATAEDGAPSLIWVCDGLA